MDDGRGKKSACHRGRLGRSLWTRAELRCRNAPRRNPTRYLLKAGVYGGGCQPICRRRCHLVRSGHGLAPKLAEEQLTSLALSGDPARARRGSAELRPQLLRAGGIAPTAAHPTVNINEEQLPAQRFKFHRAAHNSWMCGGNVRLIDLELAAAREGCGIFYYCSRRSRVERFVGLRAHALTFERWQGRRLRSTWRTPSRDRNQNSRREVQPVRDQVHLRLVLVAVLKERVSPQTSLLPRDSGVTSFEMTELRLAPRKRVVRVARGCWKHPSPDCAERKSGA